MKRAILAGLLAFTVSTAAQAETVLFHRPADFLFYQWSQNVFPQGQAAFRYQCRFLQGRFVKFCESDPAPVNGAQLLTREESGTFKAVSLRIPIGRTEPGTTALMLDALFATYLVGNAPSEGIPAQAKRARIRILNDLADGKPRVIVNKPDARIMAYFRAGDLHVDIDAVDQQSNEAESQE